jgi:hypothetical protein
MMKKKLMILIAQILKMKKATIMKHMGLKDTNNRIKYQASKKEESKGEKNIRRRVYDALNV